jgi:hypothetical protein
VTRNRGNRHQQSHNRRGPCSFNELWKKNTTAKAITLTHFV